MMSPPNDRPDDQRRDGLDEEVIQNRVDKAKNIARKEEVIGISLRRGG